MPVIAFTDVSRRELRRVKDVGKVAIPLAPPQHGDQAEQQFWVRGKTTAAKSRTHTDKRWQPAGRGRVVRGAVEREAGGN